MIFTRLFVLLALSGADALKMTAPASRRAFLSKAAAAVPLAVAAPVFATPVLNGQAQGAMAGSREKYMTGQFDASAAASRPMTDGQRKVGKNPFQGSFSDPAHSGMTRTIAFIGGRDYQIDGMDEDKKPWKVIGTRKNSDTLIVDFTPKGGPAGVIAKVLVGGDIGFPDGNVWKRL